MCIFDNSFNTADIFFISEKMEMVQLSRNGYNQRRYNVFYHYCLYRSLFNIRGLSLLNYFRFINYILFIYSSISWIFIYLRLPFFLFHAFFESYICTFLQQTGLFALFFGILYNWDIKLLLKKEDING